MMTPDGFAEPADFEKLIVAGVAVIDLMAVAAVARHRRGVGIGGDKGNAVLLEQRADDFADAAIADDDGMFLPGARPHRKLGGGRRAGAQPRADTPPDKRQARRQRHGDRGDRERGARQTPVDEAERRRHADADEGKFAAGPEQQTHLDRARP